MLFSTSVPACSTEIKEYSGTEGPSVILKPRRALLLGIEKTEKRDAHSALLVCCRSPPDGNAPKSTEPRFNRSAELCHLVLTMYDQDVFQALNCVLPLSASHNHLQRSQFCRIISNHSAFSKKMGHIEKAVMSKIVLRCSWPPRQHRTSAHRVQKDLRRFSVQGEIIAIRVYCLQK